MARAHDEDPDAAVRAFFERRVRADYFDIDSLLAPINDLAFE